MNEVLAEGNWTVSEFAWLPNNDQLVVAANNIHNPEILADELYVVDSNSGKMRGLGKPDGPFQGLRVSPDGKTLAYVSTKPNGYFNVYTRDVENGEWAGDEVAIIGGISTAFNAQQRQSGFEQAMAGVGAYFKQLLKS